MHKFARGSHQKKKKGKKKTERGKESRESAARKEDMQALSVSQGGERERERDGTSQLCMYLYSHEMRAMSRVNIKSRRVQTPNRRGGARHEVAIPREAGVVECRSRRAGRYVLYIQYSVQDILCRVCS